MRLACLAAVLLVACGDDTVNVNTSSSNFCDTIAEVACHNLYQCCTEGEIENYLHVSDPRTEVQCRDDVTRSCDRESAQIQDSLKAGRVTFDAGKMNDCLNALLAPANTCSEVVTELPWKTACNDTAFVGTVATSGACFFNFDCQGAPDSFCSPAQKCEARPTAGFPCGTGCASNFYCMSGICQAKLSVGAPCLSTSQCAKDLFCDLNATPQPICTATQPGGAACQSSQACISGTCVPGQCMGTSFSCFKNTDCSSHCANSTLSCTTSANCSSGTCSVGGNTCSQQSQCIAGGGDTCVFPVLCLPGMCIGDPVCTAQELTVDYCTGALGVLPVI
jgi:hypothetical protein